MQENHSHAHSVSFNRCEFSQLLISCTRTQHTRSLIFKIVTQNQLQRGADLHWLSVFPTEKEVLFPPLTYMQPTGLSQEVEIDGSHFTIVEVQTTQA